MNIRSLVFGLVILGSVCAPQLRSFGGAETNAEPAVTVVTPPAPVPTVVPVVEMDELRVKLEAIQRANEMATDKWIALAEQNSALSNVLAGLQETLVSQRKRETELAEQARASTNNVLLGAAAGVFLVFMASYWFQLRCMNRVMELSRTPPALPASLPNALIESHAMQDSKLLEAVKLLESRIQHLEAPAPSIAAAANGGANENGHAPASEPKLIEAAPAESQSGSPKVSLLLAKGEILLDMERYQESLIAFHEALALEPANAEAHLKKGIALERMNRLELSLAAYEEAVRLNPSRAFAYVHKARVLAALHRYDEALSVYDLALGKNSSKSATGPALGNGSRGVKGIA